MADCLWLELLKAIDAALPKDTRPPDKRKETEEDIAQRPELHIESMDCEYFTDLASWQTGIQKYYTPTASPAAAPAAAPAADGTAQPNAAAPAPGQTADANGGCSCRSNTAGHWNRTAPNCEFCSDNGACAAPTDTAATPAITPTDGAAAAPTDATAAGAAGGWIIELKGYHYHNSLPDKKVNVGDEGEEFVKNTFIKNLETGKVMLPDDPDGKEIEVPIADLGIKTPVVLTKEKIRTVLRAAESADLTAISMGPGRGPEGTSLAPGALATGVDQPKTFKLRKYPFVIQFLWQPQPRSARQEKMAQKKAAAASTAAAEAPPAETKPSS